jgi:hypothetical protein
MELWDAVEAVCKERPKDRRAMAAILRAVPRELKAGLAVKKTAKEAWEAVRSMRIDDDRVKATSLQRLWKEYENVGFHDGESVSDFALRINGLVASLREMGETLEDHRVVKKILRVVPKRLKQVAMATEMLTDLNMMTIEELVGRLRVAEDADNNDAKEAIAKGVEQLLLTEEQWDARRRQRGKDHARGGNGRHGNGDDNDHDNSDDDTSSTLSGISRHDKDTTVGAASSVASGAHGV